jgi:hypothetical protein
MLLICCWVPNLPVSEKRERERGVHASGWEVWGCRWGDAWKRGNIGTRNENLKPITWTTTDTNSPRVCVHHTTNTIQHTGKKHARSDDEFDSDDSVVVQETPPRKAKKLAKRPDKTNKKRKRGNDSEEDEPEPAAELYVSPGTTHQNTMLLI